MRIGLSVAAVLVGLVSLGPTPQTASASTMTYYYVSNPYTVSNFAGQSDDRRLMTTGTVVLDATQLEGQGFGGDRVIQERDWSRFNDFPLPVLLRSPGFVSASFDYGDGGQLSGSEAGIDVTFDFDGQARRWSMRDDRAFPECFTACYQAAGDIWTGEGFDGQRGIFDSDAGGFLWPTENREAFLVNAGLAPGTSKFSDLIKRDEIWEWTTFAAGPGQWFDNPLDYARQVEENTRLALANPAFNIYEIAPVPVPAPLALMLGGIGALVLVRRRQTRRPQRS